MILVDMNQISLASVMMHLNMNKKVEPDIDMVRHMILNSVRMYRTKFFEEYGELVLCYDSKLTGVVTTSPTPNAIAKRHGTVLI